MVVRNIQEATNFWFINVEFWNYKTDGSSSGELIRLSIGKLPEDYEDSLFCLTPIDDYLDKASESLPSEYYKEGYSIFKQAISDTGKDYKWEKEFDTRGILAVETYYDEFDQVIVRLEGTFRIIPFGTDFIGFSIVAIVAIIFISLKKKKIRTASF